MDNSNEFPIGSVTFDTKSKTYWHTHPKGQILIVIGGKGFYLVKGKPVQPTKKET